MSVEEMGGPEPESMRHACLRCGGPCFCYCAGCIGAECCHFLTSECRQAQASDGFDDDPRPCSYCGDELCDADCPEAVQS